MKIVASPKSVHSTMAILMRYLYGLSTEIKEKRGPTGFCIAHLQSCDHTFEPLHNQINTVA